MLVFGTQMHIATFLFICIELVILFYLVIYRLARPDDTTTTLNIVLIILLLIYNITGGLLPDANLPGSYFIQESVAYGTGFITPCFFPYYVFKGFELRKMKFHVSKGVFLFLALPYILFVVLFFAAANINVAKNLLIVPVLYAIWVLFSVRHSIHFKYTNRRNNRKSKEEIIVLFISLTPWVGLPFIAYFDLNQFVEAITTNTGFLLLLALHVKRNVERLKDEHLRLIESEQRLRNWNEQLRAEVDRRTKELEKITAEERLLQNCKSFNLTNRETEIARLICQGLTHKYIAETLFIAERTVAKHAQNIFEKTRVGNKIELCMRLEKHINHKAITMKINEK